MGRKVMSHDTTYVMIRKGELVLQAEVVQGVSRIWLSAMLGNIWPAANFGARQSIKHVLTMRLTAAHFPSALLDMSVRDKLFAKTNCTVEMQTSSKLHTTCGRSYGV